MKKIFKWAGIFLLMLLVLCLLCGAVCVRVWIYRKLGAWIGVSPFIAFLIFDISWWVILMLIFVILTCFKDNNSDKEEVCEKEKGEENERT